MVSKILRDKVFKKLNIFLNGKLKNTSFSDEYLSLSKMTFTTS
jgi:hypothetical protein